MPYPSTISAFTNPQATDRLNSPSHSSIESAQNTGLTELQTFVGTTNASAVGTLIYDIRAAGSDGGGHVQTANKGGTGQTSFSKGDILVAQSSSVISKLAIGANNTDLTASSGDSVGMKWQGQGASIQSLIPPLALFGTVSSTIQYSSSIVQNYGLINIPANITVNTVSMEVTSVLTGGSFRLGLYAENGQSSLFSGVVSSVTTNGVKNFQISSVMVAAGNYWTVFTTLNGRAHFRTWIFDSIVTNLSNLSNATGISTKGAYTGTLTTTAGNLPTTFTPSAIAANAQVATVIRLDN